MRLNQGRTEAWVVACGVLGPLMLAAYFAAPLFAPPLGRVIYAAHPATAEVVRTGSRYHELLYAGGWLQATGALLAVIFFLAVAGMASTPESLAIRIVQLGSAVLVAVALAEVIFTFTWASAAVNGQTASSRTSFDLMAAFIRVFPIVPAPAVYLPIGALLLRSPVLPRAFGYLAIGLGAAFLIAGLTGALLPAAAAATAGLAAIQVIWIIAAAIALYTMARKALAKPDFAADDLPRDLQQRRALSERTRGQQIRRVLWLAPELHRDHADRLLDDRLTVCQIQEPEDSEVCGWLRALREAQHHLGECVSHQLGRGSDALRCLGNPVVRAQSPDAGACRPERGRAYRLNAQFGDGRAVAGPLIEQRCADGVHQRAVGSVDGRALTHDHLEVVRRLRRLV